LLALFLCNGPAAAFAQTPAGPEAARPEFDAASVRRNKSTAPATSLFPLGPGDAFVPGSLFSAVNQPLIAYLRFAYKLGQGDLLGLPAWVYSDTFDIQARAPGGAPKDQMRLMMRALLADRFKLTTHMEPENRPVFNLVLAKPQRTGPQLRRDPDCSGASPIAAGVDLPSIPCGSLGPVSGSTPEKGRLAGRGVTIARIAAILSNPFTGVDRPVLDRTGLAGSYDFSVEWSLARDRALLPDAGQNLGIDTGDDGPAFPEALEKQLGLKLVSTTGPVDVLVIDRVEPPQDN
jgi:uncharacterized protein (TIGR03435 family)